MRQERVYFMINSMVIVFSTLIFVISYRGKTDLLFVENGLAVIILLGTVIAVNMFKCIRLYFALYGTKISLKEHIKQYCKTVPVSMLVPLKAGDIFRGYCYGYKTNHYLRAFIIILLDRFIDTLALVTVTFFLILSGHEAVPALVYLMLLFLVLVIAGYYIFPGLYSYWNDYFIRNKASVRRNSFLRLLRRCHVIYAETANLIRGRCLFLYGISVLAWGIEIGGMVCIRNILLEEVSLQVIIDYLNSALGMSRVICLQRFVFFSVVFMLLLYLLIYVRKIAKERKL